MNIKNIYSGFRGIVRWSIVDKLSKSVVDTGQTDNTVLYSGADILAKLVGGNTNYQPKFMGFIFGNDPNPMFTESIPRAQTWSSIGSELQGRNCNILVVPVTSPSYSVDKSQYVDATYNNNIVTLTGVTDSSDGEYAFAGAGYKDALDDRDRVYGALLLAKVRNSSGVFTYVPFSRVSLRRKGVYPEIVPGFALCAMWDVIFY